MSKFYDNLVINLCGDASEHSLLLFYKGSYKQESQANLIYIFTVLAFNNNTHLEIYKYFQKS